MSGSWIFIVVIVLLFNSITEPPVLYGVGYFLLWAAIILNLAVSRFSINVLNCFLDFIPCVSSKYFFDSDYFDYLLVGRAHNSLLLPIPVNPRILEEVDTFE